MLISPIHVPLPMEHRQEIPIAFPSFSLKGKRKKRQEEGSFQKSNEYISPYVFGSFK